MASHIEGMVFPGRTTGLTRRLRERLARMMEALTARDEIRSSLPLASGERVLTMTCDSSGSWVAASERACVVPLRRCTITRRCPAGVGPSGVGRDRQGHMG